MAVRLPLKPQCRIAFSIWMEKSDTTEQGVMDTIPCALQRIGRNR